MMRFYHISIIWLGTEKSVETVRPIVDLAMDWYAYGNSFYAIYTSEDIYVWQGRFKALIGAGDSFIITEINDVHQTGGWMPPTFWEWLRKERPQTISSLIPSYSLTPPKPFQT